MQRKPKCAWKEITATVFVESTKKQPRNAARFVGLIVEEDLVALPDLQAFPNVFVGDSFAHQMRKVDYHRSQTGMCGR